MILLVSLLIPLLVGLIVYLGGKKLSNSLLGAISALSLLIPLGLLMLVYGMNTLETYPWISQLGIGFSLYSDGLSWPISVAILLLGALASIYSVGYMKGEHDLSSYYANLIFFVAAMYGLVLAADLIEFYVFWELMLVPSYLLISFWGHENAKGAGYKYIIYTHFGAIFLLISILMLWFYSGTTNMFDVAATLHAPVWSFQIIISFMLLGFLIKMGVFPFHTWLPDAHANAPTPISVLLSGVMVSTGGYALMRFAGFMLPHLMPYAPVMMLLGTVSIIYGGLMALMQSDVKRLFAYSSVSQMGYIVFGAGTMTYFGFVGANYHIFAHALGKGLLFMVAGVMITQMGTRDMRKISGLAKKMPVVATSALIAVFSLAGTPPMAGFISEWTLFTGGIQSGNFMLTAVTLVLSLITASYMLWFIRKVFFGPMSEAVKNVKVPPASMRYAIATLAVLSILFGLFPGFLLDVMIPAVMHILGIVGGVF